jgi:AraC family ethanolamine operon transcriptional activator
MRTATEAQGSMEPTPDGGRRPARFQAGLPAVVHTNDFDVMAGYAPGWSQEYVQVGRGPFSGTLKVNHTASVQFGTVEWNPGILVRGAAPDGSAVLAVPLGAPHAMHNGRPLRRGQLGMVTKGEEIDFRASDSFRLFVAACDADVLEEHAQLVLGVPVRELVSRAATEDPEITVARCEAFLRGEFAAYLDTPHRLAEPAVARRVESTVLDLMLSCVRLQPRAQAFQAGAVLARRAEDWMRSQLHLPLCMRDLCAELAVPERTLHLAFRRHRETTPMQHFKTLRLNAVHRALRGAEHGARVTDVALRWGFDHPGWFAHDYRRMFGCTPSETLRRAQARTRAAR